MATPQAECLKIVKKENEDWRDVNELAERFGVSFNSGRLVGENATSAGSHELTAGVATLRLVDGNGVRFSYSGGETIAQAGSAAALAVVQHGAGEVVVVADLSILGNRENPPPNLRFWQNLARYARR